MFLRIKKLEKRAQRKYNQAARSVKEGYDPSVPLGEFRRRLNVRSRAFDEQLDVKSAIRDMNY